MFASMDKNMTETTLSTNYGDFLLSAVEKAKDQFTDEEYKTLTADAEKIRDIENQIAALAPAEDTSSSAAAQGTAFMDPTDPDGGCCCRKNNGEHCCGRHSHTQEQTER